VRDGSRFTLFATVRAYRLGAEAGSILTPLLIVDAPPDSVFAGQARELHRRLPGVSENSPDGIDCAGEVVDGLVAHMRTGARA
jgi:hypothetical protein